MEKRAMTEEAKAAKAQLILDKAKEMFLVMDYGKIKMADIAKAVGMSNGILFVYFNTKETLFMNLIWQEYENRLNFLKELAQSAKIKSYNDIKKLLLTELEYLVDNNPLYIRLNFLRTQMTETNADTEIINCIKRSISTQMLDLVAIISDSGILAQEQLLEILFTEEAIITGFKVKMITHIGERIFERNFKKEVIEAFGYYLDGVGYKLRNL